MSLADEIKAPIQHADRFFIGGQWGAAIVGRHETHIMAVPSGG
jgi:hypothetical protein